MAESTAALKFDDLMARVAERAGYGYLADQAAGLSAAQETETELYVAEGYQDFLLSYEWGFLKPTTTLNLWGTVTGTVTIHILDGVNTVVGVTEDSFYPSMVGHSFVFDATGNSYTIVSYTDATTIIVEGNATGESSSDTFTITPDGSYQLSDDFGGLLGDVYFQANEGRWIPLSTMGVAELLELLQVSTGTGRPTVCAVDPQVVPTAASGATGQRDNLIVWRIPDSNYPVTFQYQVLAPKLIADGYPYGGARHAETIKHACFAAMERSKFQLADGPLQRQYNRLLALSIKADQRGARAHTLGFLVDARPYRWRRGTYGPLARTVTVGGVAYP